MKDYQFWILIASQVLGTIGLFLQLNNKIDTKVDSVRIEIKNELKEIRNELKELKDEQAEIKIELTILKTEFVGLKNQLTRLEKQIEFIYDQLFVPRFPKREDAA